MEALRVMVANGAAMGLTMSVPKCEVYGEEKPGPEFPLLHAMSFVP